ncbi:GntR family transcriptional regulator [Pseudomonas sp. KNUC1026]|uniref:GntR family transcriptional regulator n=1 Tax=Pseudomonas sp. KNUC1026 TaxID=2893890 RepID=UPI001F476420|nr:GntR family transcriptional regulator [Pseudomonas sp. KNUC1026]UFH50939.1 GntR family transcriptional regulator [Pseudomonas sp. KNUC1026]
MDHVNQGIAARIWPAGARLPSVRGQARSLKVSVSTVVEAYERLCAEGVLLSRPGSGFYVAGPAAPLTLTQVAPQLDRAIDPLWVSRQALETDASLSKPGCGWLPPAWLYEQGVRRALRALARSDTLELARVCNAPGPSRLAPVPLPPPGQRCHRGAA